jgi:hypothetical protein
MTADRRPSGEALARIRALSERQLSSEEIDAALRTPVNQQEREEVLALVAWFRRRYPTPAERLGYVRRAYVRWLRATGRPK